MSLFLKIKDCYKFYAFTLVEIIIVIGIIGIIAQITIPTLVQNIQQKELQTLFQKTYSELNQIALQFKQDNGITIPEQCSTSSGCNTFIQDIFWKYFKAHEKISEAIAGGSIDAPYKIKSFDGKSYFENGICDNSGYHTELAGKIYTFNDPTSLGTNGPTVCVDINGKKTPNRIGWDYFLFVFTVDGSVIPMGQPHPQNTTNTTNWFNNAFIDTCKSTITDMPRDSYGCAYWALLNKNPNYPNDSTKNYWNDFLKK